MTKKTTVRKTQRVNNTEKAVADKYDALCVNIQKAVETFEAAVTDYGEVCRRASEVVETAQKGVLAALQEANAEGRRVLAQMPAPPLPAKDNVFDVDGYATYANGVQHLDPAGNPVRTEDMFRKIEKQDWNA